MEISRTRTRTSARSARSEDESWAAVVDMDDAPDEEKSCNTLSALTNTAALTSDIDSENSRIILEIRPDNPGV